MNTSLENHPFGRNGSPVLPDGGTIHSWQSITRCFLSRKRKTSLKSSRPTTPIGRNYTSIRGQAVRLVPQIYHNGWLALCLELADTEEPYTILTVNLEELDAIGLPDRAFIDINNNPDAMEFLELNHSRH